MRDDTEEFIHRLRAWAKESSLHHFMEYEEDPPEFFLNYREARDAADEWLRMRRNEETLRRTLAGFRVGGQPEFVTVSALLEELLDLPEPEDDE